MKNISQEVEANRRRWMGALRSGQYKKGPIPKLDNRGRPAEPADGYCACAVLVHEFPDGTFSDAKKAVGVTSRQCSYIQAELSDKLETFEEVADRIESEIFSV